MTKQLQKIILVSVFISTSILCFGQEKNKQQILTGSGSFLIEGGFNQETDSIEIYYYKPKNYQSNFKIMLVLPGGGRNGDGYRDKWIDLANTYKLLIIAPSYSKKKYPKSKNYNLGRLSSSSFIKKTVKNKTGKEPWIFDDFDRIFDTTVKLTGSTQNTNDLFGHSAGGQIAHRLAIFNPNTKVNRIVAANSGWYTLPNFNINFPYGLKNLQLSKNQLTKSFKTQLILLLGEKDNASETRGHLRNTKEAKAQGFGRFSRGSFFYTKAFEEAKKLHCEFSWKKKVVKGVGHSSDKMAIAAANYLYGLKGKRKIP